MNYEKPEMEVLEFGNRVATDLVIGVSGGEDHSDASDGF